MLLKKNIIWTFSQNGFKQKMYDEWNYEPCYFVKLPVSQLLAAWKIDHHMWKTHNVQVIKQKCSVLREQCKKYAH